MTLQVLRNRVGDDAFWQIARDWVSERGGGTGTTAQFIELSERVSGQQLDDLFDAWLFTASKPSITSVAALGARSADSGDGDRAAADSTRAVERWSSAVQERLAHGRY